MQTNISRKLTMTLLIASAILSVLPVALADEEVVETRRTTTIEASSTPANSSTTTTTTTTQRASNDIIASPGGSEFLTSSDAQSILQTVDQRRAEIDKKIVAARTDGTLSEARSADLRRELDRVGAEVADMKSQANPSLARSISLAQDLDVLAAQVRTVYTSYTYVPIIEGSHFTIFNGHIIQLDELAVRRIGLENKILDRLAERKISYRQSVDLRSDLNAISAREDSCRNSRVNGKLSDKEAREIYNAFDKVAVKLDTFSHS